VVLKPSDLGYPNTGYDLPPIHRYQITIPANEPISLDALDVGQQGSLIPIEASTMNERRGARRDSIESRARAFVGLVNNSAEQWVIWCGLNDESKLACSLIPDAVEVTGSDKRDFKYQTVLDFIAGKIRVLVSKGAIFGHGLNLQCCHNWVHFGLSD
jgi:hypothetical protein